MDAQIGRSESSRRLLEYASSVTNDPISGQEQLRLAAGLKEAEAAAEATGPTAQQLEYIRQILAEILDSSKRLGRKDFINALIGL